jgi:hypothetical protein
VAAARRGEQLIAAAAEAGLPREVFDVGVRELARRLKLGRGYVEGRLSGYDHGVAASGSHLLW